MKISYTFLFLFILSGVYRYLLSKIYTPMDFKNNHIQIFDTKVRLNIHYVSWGLPLGHINLWPAPTLGRV